MKIFSRWRCLEEGKREELCQVNVNCELKKDLICVPKIPEKWKKSPISYPFLFLRGGGAFCCLQYFLSNFFIPTIFFSKWFVFDKKIFQSNFLAPPPPVLLPLICFETATASFLSHRAVWRRNYLFVMVIHIMYYLLYYLSCITYQLPTG